MASKNFKGKVLTLEQRTGVLYSSSKGKSCCCNSKGVGCLENANTDIFNVDETGLFYRALPMRTMAIQGTIDHLHQDVTRRQKTSLLS